MISIREKWHYFAVKNLSAFGDFFCLNCFHSFATENKLQLHKEAFENKDFCTVNIPSADTKILQFDQYQKSEKASFIIYTDLDVKQKRLMDAKNNPENQSSTKVSEHIPSGFSISTISLFRSIKNNHDVYRGKDCMRKFCELLREHTMKF